MAAVIPGIFAELPTRNHLPSQTLPRESYTSVSVPSLKFSSVVIGSLADLLTAAFPASVTVPLAHGRCKANGC